MIRNGLRVRAKSNKKVGSVEASSASSAIDPGLVRELALMVGESGLAEIEIEKGDLRIRLTRHHPAPVSGAGPAADQGIAQTFVAAAPPAGPTTASTAPELDPAAVVKSPMVGTVYRRSNPESKPFVEIGSIVKLGERLLLIEAMKTFNDIVAHKAGTVAAILVDDGQPVEYGEPLLLIE